MRMCIIGPEGAGKTVFVTMLSHYVSTHRKDLILEPLDYSSAQYLTRAQQSLHQGEWPSSNRQGEIRVLKWRFHTKEGTGREIFMIDTSGQDLRHILLHDLPTQLTPDQQMIRQEVDQADVLIYLLDVGSLLTSQDMMPITENAWLFKTLLSRPEWIQKKRIVVVSKADLYQEMLRDEQLDVRALIQRLLPSHLALGHLIEKEKNVIYLAIASVITSTEINKDGNPLRKPVVPLKSDGFDELLKIILSSVEEAIGTELGCVVSIIFSLIFIVAGIFFGLPWVYILLVAVLGFFLGFALGFVSGLKVINRIKQSWPFKQ